MTKEFIREKSTPDLSYETFLFFAPKDLISLYMVSSFWRQTVQSFVNSNNGSHWGNNYIEGCDIQVKLSKDKHQKNYTSAIHKMDELIGMLFKYSKYIIVTGCLYKIEKSNPQIMASFRPFELVRNITIGSFHPLVAGALVLITGTMAYQSAQYCKKNIEYKKRKEELAKLFFICKESKTTPNHSEQKNDSSTRSGM